MSHISHSSRLNWWMSILILIFIFSPILSAQPDAHPAALYVVPIVLVALFIALKGWFIKSSSANFYAALLFFFAIVSTLISDIGGLGPGLLKYFVFIVFFISISNFVIPQKQLKFIFISYLSLSVVLSILIIMSYIYGYPHIMESSGYQSRYSIGITGLFKNPNYITSFYNVSFFIICYMLATIKLSFPKRIILYAFLALFITSSFFSGTRAALVVEVLILASVPIVMAKRHNIYKLLPLAIVIMIVIVYYWSTLMDLYDLFLGARDLIGDSGREEAWTYAIKYIKQNPIFGCGHKSWNVICKGTGCLEYLHNIFLELFLDQGLIGLLLVIGIIFTGSKRTNNNDRSFLILLLIVTAFPMFFQNGLYEVNFWRFIIINRLMMNISASYEGGISAFLNNSFGLSSHSFSKQTNKSLSQLAVLNEGGGC